MAKTDKEREEELKSINKSNNARRSLFDFNKRKDDKTKFPKNDVTAGEKRLRTELNKENQLINSTLFGGYEKTIDQYNDTEGDPSLALQKKLQAINDKFKGTTGGNPVEFFNRLELDKSDKTIEPGDSNSKGKKTNRLKKLEKMLKNSNGEFFLEEKDRFFRYEDYRLIDSYIPEVSKCLDLYRDCILSPDDITKRSLTYFYSDRNTERSNDPEINYVNNNLKTLENIYKLPKLIRTDIREACREGDLFYLIMPYDIGFNKIVLKDDLEIVTTEFDNGEVLTEDTFNLDNDSDFNALFEEVTYLSDKSDKAKDKLKTIERSKREILDSINNNVKFFKDPSDVLSEIKREKKESNTKFDGLHLPGSIFKKLMPENIVALEIDHNVIGYIYIEKNDINMAQKRTNQRNANPNSLRSGNTGSTINTSDSLGYGSNDVFNSRYDYLNRDQNQIKSKYQLISSIFIKGISKKINKDFLIRNQEFKELIYTLVHEEYITKKEIKMTFIEPCYIKHLALNSTEMYGVSKISKSLFFSKIYLSNLLTNLMQKIIRGRDKRAYYIEVGLDDNIEDTIQGFIKDIKSKELTSGYLKNITTILNSVGAFEDFYMPVIDGQRAVEIDTVPGMDIEIDNEFNQYLLKSIITGMGVPYNYIDSTSEIDFARTLTMTNNPFVRSIVNDQDEFGEFYSDVIRTLYKNEFLPPEKRDVKTKRKTTVSRGGKKIAITIDVDAINLRFPTPIYLVLGNTNEQINNAQTTIEYLVQQYFPDDPTQQEMTFAREKQKANFRRRLAKDFFLPTLEWDKYDKIFEETKYDGIEEDIKNKVKFPEQGKKASDMDTIEEDEFDDD